MNPNPDVRARAAKIKLLLMDVDGVMTNGKLFHVPGEAGTVIETKGFDSQDGIALADASGRVRKTGAGIMISNRSAPQSARAS